MARRLFHAIVLVGSGMGTACASRDAPTTPADGGGETSADSSSTDDTFPGIMPMMIDSGTVATDTRPDTFPTIMADTKPPPDTKPPADTSTPPDTSASD